MPIDEILEKLEVDVVLLKNLLVPINVSEDEITTIIWSRRKKFTCNNYDFNKYEHSKHIDGIKKCPMYIANGSPDIVNCKSLDKHTNLTTCPFYNQCYNLVHSL
jgi:hypothetical protein